MHYARNYNYWEQQVLNIEAKLEGKSLEEKASILRNLCYSHYKSGFSDGYNDGGYHYISKVDEY